MRWVKRLIGCISFFLLLVLAIIMLHNAFSYVELMKDSAYTPSAEPFLAYGLICLCGFIALCFIASLVIILTVDDD